MNVLDDKSVEAAFSPSDRGFVYAIARRIVGSPDDAEDVTQDALLLAYRHRDSFRGESRYRTWLYRIATTTALGHLRRMRRARLRLSDETVPLELADPALSPEQQVADAQSRRLVRTALRKLDAKYRDVLVARAETSESETAEGLGISVANVKIRAHRARKQLRDAVEALAA